MHTFVQYSYQVYYRDRDVLKMCHVERFIDITYFNFNDF